MPKGCFHNDLKSGTAAVTWKGKMLDHNCQPDFTLVLSFYSYRHTTATQNAQVRQRNPLSFSASAHHYNLPTLQNFLIMTNNFASAFEPLKRKLINKRQPKQTSRE